MWLSAGAIMASACFCSYAPFADRITTVEPQAVDVVGVYVLSMHTMVPDRTAAPKPGSARIELFGDGTYTATGFPVWTAHELSGYEVQDIISQKGTWQVCSAGSVNDDTAWGVCLNPAFDNLSITPDLTHNEPPYGLLFTYGDPDSGNVVEFVRVKEKSIGP